MVLSTLLVIVWKTTIWENTLLPPINLSPIGENRNDAIILWSTFVTCNVLSQFIFFVTKELGSNSLSWKNFNNFFHINVYIYKE